MSLIRQFAFGKTRLFSAKNGDKCRKKQVRRFGVSNCVESIESWKLNARILGFIRVILSLVIQEWYNIPIFVDRYNTIWGSRNVKENNLSNSGL